MIRNSGEELLNFARGRRTVAESGTGDLEVLCGSTVKMSDVPADLFGNLVRSAAERERERALPTPVTRFRGYRKSYHQTFRLAEY